MCIAPLTKIDSPGRWTYQTVSDVFYSVTWCRLPSRRSDFTHEWIFVHLPTAGIRPMTSRLAYGWPPTSREELQHRWYRDSRMVESVFNLLLELCLCCTVKSFPILYFTDKQAILCSINWCVFAAFTQAKHWTLAVLLTWTNSANIVFY